MGWGGVGVRVGWGVVRVGWGRGEGGFRGRGEEQEPTRPWIKICLMDVR